METLEKIWTYEMLITEFAPETRVELLDNEIFMPPSPSPDHQRTSRNLEFLLYEFVRKNKLGEVFDAPFDVILSNTKVVQPDIVFISTKNLPNITKRGYEGIPDLIVEIISPSTFYHDSVTKFRLYEALGVQEYWLLEPANKVIEVFRLENGKYELHCFVVETGKATSKLLQGFEVEAGEIFGA
jgi:Uma2 family endonuclease